MELSFSQRMGLKPVKSIIQIDSVDEDLRKGLWNVFVIGIWRCDRCRDVLLPVLWVSYFSNTIDTLPVGIDRIFDYIKVHFFKCEWHEVYDFIECVVDTLQDRFSIVGEFIETCNIVLERELSGYRFISGRIAPLTSVPQIVEVEKALDASEQFTQHLRHALELFADRKSPDYKNSIKESISAVEAICCLITKSSKATLGDALKQLESKLSIIHPALKDAFSKLYGYTSDADGIRHGLLGKSDLRVEDARFMLISCSAFINYLMVKADKAGIDLYSK